MKTYAIYRNQTDVVLGFVVDDDEVPVAYENRKEAKRALKDHMLFRAGLVEFVDL